MKIKNISNPVYASEDQLQIDCQIVFENDDGTTLGPFPFTASSNDVEDHGRLIYAQIKGGGFGKIAKYIAPKPLPSAPQPTLADLQAQLADLTAKIDAISKV